MAGIFVDVAYVVDSATVNFGKQNTPALHPTLVLRLSGVTWDMLENCTFEVSLIGRHWYRGAYSAHMGRVTCEAEVAVGQRILIADDPEGVYVEAVFNMAVDSPFIQAIACPFLGIFVGGVGEPIIVPSEQLVHLFQHRTDLTTMACFYDTPTVWTPKEHAAASFEAIGSFEE